jgi:hypothetical protein
MRDVAMARGRRWWVGLALLAIASCQGPADPPSDAAIAFAPAALASLRFKAVLVAGDDAQPVFDNATRYLHDRLIAAGLAAENIHRLSAADRPAMAPKRRRSPPSSGGLPASRPARARGAWCFSPRTAIPAPVSSSRGRTTI